MNFRITMGMKMNTYRYNLMNSNVTLSQSMEKVQTGRNFNSYAEAPAAATNAWRVRRNIMDNASYQTQNKDVTTRFQTAWLSMGTMKTDLEQYISKNAVIRAANDPTGEAKEQLGKVLSNAAETVIQNMNEAKYGDDFVFAGTNGTEPPFSWDGDKLLYRGINLTPPSMMPNGTQKWPDYWGELDRKTGIPVNLPTAPDPNAPGGTPGPNDPAKDWEFDDKGVLTGTYKAPKTAAKQEFVDNAGNKLSLPVTDNGITYHQAVDKDGKPAMVEMEDGGTTPFVDENGKPVPAPTSFTVTNEDGTTTTYNATTTGTDEVPVVDEAGNAVWETKQKGEVPQDQKDWYIYFKNMETLNKLSAETQYADLGMGMAELKDENGNPVLVDGTYFNNAIPGINMLGYGVDEDGDPKNLALIMKKFNQVLSTVDSNGSNRKRKKEE